MNLFYLLKPKATVVYLDKNATLRSGLSAMRQHGYTAVPVIDESGEYIGTVSEGDFLWHVLESPRLSGSFWDQCHVIDIVNEERNRPVKSDVGMEELLLRVMDQNFVPVVDDRSTFIGIITRKAIIQYFYEKEKQQLSREKSDGVET